MYRNLLAEMVRKNLTTKDLANYIQVDPRTARNKLCGRAEFKWPEVLKIRDYVAPEKPLEELFKKCNDSKAQ